MKTLIKTMKTLITLIFSLALGCSAALPPVMKNVWSTNGNTTLAIQQAINSQPFPITNAGSITSTGTVTAAAGFSGPLSFSVDDGFLYYANNAFYVNSQGHCFVRDILNVSNGTNNQVRLFSYLPSIFSNGLWAASLSANAFTFKGITPVSFIQTNGITGVWTNYTYFTNGLAYTNIAYSNWVAWP
jgi:hypothetical protein